MNPKLNDINGSATQSVKKIEPSEFKIPDSWTAPKLSPSGTYFSTTQFTLNFTRDSYWISITFQGILK